VHKKLFFIAILAGLAIPGIALATTIDASLIPDGTYTVKVEKLIDSKHVQVAMDNGAETTLAAGRDGMTFAKFKPGDSVKLSLIKGLVMVFVDVTNP